jgi:hypothetical protein
VSVLLQWDGTGAAAGFQHWRHVVASDPLLDYRELAGELEQYQHAELIRPMTESKRKHHVAALAVFRERLQAAAGRVNGEGVRRGIDHKVLAELLDECERPLSVLWNRRRPIAATGIDAVAVWGSMGDCSPTRAEQDRQSRALAEDEAGRFVDQWGDRFYGAWYRLKRVWDGFPPKEEPAPDSIVFVKAGVYRIGDGEPIKVEESDDDVLRAFLDTPAMNRPQLTEHFGDGNAPRVLKRLTKKYGGVFARHIRLPGKRGQGGYHVNIRRA